MNLTLSALRAHQSLVLDANILVLVAVGLGRRDLLERHRRTQNFSARQFQLCAEAAIHHLGRSSLWATPHVLSQASDLLEGDLQPIWTIFKDQMRLAKEHHTDAATLVTRKTFDRLGLADNGLMALMEAHKAALLTADLNLYLSAQDQGLPSYNVRHCS